MGVEFTERGRDCADGIWGPRLQAAHDRTVEAIQAAVGAVASTVSYGPSTNAAVSIALAGAEKP